MVDEAEWIPLNQSPLLYRAIRPGWRDKDTDQLLPPAFIIDREGELGLSVNADYDKAYQSLRSHGGIASLETGTIRQCWIEGFPEIRLDVMHRNNDEDPQHHEIRGIPLLWQNRSDDALHQAANDVADALIDIADFPVSRSDLSPSAE